jgi:hypothetical protein
MASRLKPLLFLITLALSLTVVNVARLESTAHAAGLDRKGKAEAKEATQLYKEGRYEEAARIFAKLSVKYPDMEIFERNVGACFYYMRKPEPALSNLRNYLNHKKAIAPDDKTVVDRWIAEMEELRAQQAATRASAEQPPKSLAAPLPASAAPSPGEMAIRPAGADLTSERTSSAVRQPIYKTWWFWTAAAAMVAGTVTAILLARRSNDPCDGASLACVGVK